MTLWELRESVESSIPAFALVLPVIAAVVVGLIVFSRSRD